TGTLTAGAVSITAQNDVTVNNITATGTIAISANQDGMGAESYTQNGLVQTTDNTANAVSILVNTAAGGTGGAALRDIAVGSGGTITVNTQGGSITQAAGTLDAGTGTVTLIGGSIGTAGASVQVAGGQLSTDTSAAGDQFLSSTGTTTVTSLNA